MDPDLLRIESLFRRSPASKENTQHNDSPRRLTVEEVAVLLDCRCGNDQQSIEQAIRKQAILERHNMFDPAKYFGGSGSLDRFGALDERKIDEMFQRSGSCRSFTKQPSNGSAVKTEKMLSSVCSTLKKDFNSTRKINVDDGSKRTKLRLRLRSSSKDKQFVPSKTAEILICEEKRKHSSKHNKENNFIEINKCAVARKYFAQPSDKPTVMQRLRLRLRQPA